MAPPRTDLDPPVTSTSAPSLATPTITSGTSASVRSAALHRHAPDRGTSAGRHGVVQCMADVSETGELLALAQREPLIKAVVGWADLTSPAIGDVLDGLLAGPGGSYLRSLRHLVQGETDPAWLQRPDVERGLAAVRDRGLCYDVLVRSHQLDQAIRPAERFPDLPQVLDHAGRPPIAQGELADREGRLRLPAGHPGCKVSGLITEADHGTWTTAAVPADTATAFYRL
jgi:L-fuconolactonase